MTLEIIPRAAWGARPPDGVWPITLPTPELWLHHSAGSESGAAGVRRIQNFHMDDRGWSDIAYSFVVDRDTLDVFEGRGAGKRGGHTFGHNRVSHGICVMGNFESIHWPSDELIRTLGELVRYGHARGWWPAELSGGHRDVRATSCPGIALYNAIDDINALATEDGDTPMTLEELTMELQRTLLSHGAQNLGTSGPNNDGVDGIPGVGTIGDSITVIGNLSALLENDGIGEMEAGRLAAFESGTAAIATLLDKLDDAWTEMRAETAHPDD